jgi:hypothetical protein
MKGREEDNTAAACATQELPHDWADRIRKLRWLGLDDEAKRLEAAAATQVPKERRRSVSGGPFNTD